MTFVELVRDVHVAVKSHATCWVECIVTRYGDIDAEVSVWFRVTVKVGKENVDSNWLKVEEHTVEAAHAKFMEGWGKVAPSALLIPAQVEDARELRQTGN